MPALFRTIRSSVSRGVFPEGARETLVVLWRSQSGQSLIEASAVLAVTMTLCTYAVDFGYFFIVAANLTSSSRTAAQFSIQGFETPGQTTLATAGPPSTAGSVAALALADLGSLPLSTTVTAITVCSKSLGVTGNFVNCAAYSTGSASGTYTSTSSTATMEDPEAPTFYLNRVDVTYTVQPPIPISLLTASLVPNLNFHRYVVMRAED